MPRNRDWNFRTRVQRTHPYSREVATKQLNMVQSLNQQVASLTAELHLQKTSTQQAEQRTSELKQEVQELHDMLRKARNELLCERTERIQLGQELEEARDRLTRQKQLNKIFIKNDKESRRETAMVKKYADSNTLSNTKIADQVRDTIKYRNKKPLQRDYEELKVAHIKCQERFEAELQAERERYSLLSQEVEQMKLLNQEASQRSESVGHQAEFLQQRLEMEIKSHADIVEENLHLMNKLRAEQEAMCQMMAEQAAVLQRDASRREQSLLQEVEQLKSQLTTQASLNFQAWAELEAEMEAERHESEPPRRKIARHELKPVEEVVCKQETESLPSVPALPTVLDFPILPVLPIVPDLPAALDFPIVPDLPAVLDFPIVPDLPAVLDFPIVPDLPAVLDFPIVPDLPTVLDLPIITDLPTVPAVENLEEASEAEKLPEWKNKMSTWKRTRHFLGLRKPQKWKKQKQESN